MPAFSKCFFNSALPIYAPRIPPKKAPKATKAM